MKGVWRLKVPAPPPPTTAEPPGCLCRPCARVHLWCVLTCLRFVCVCLVVPVKWLDETGTAVAPEAAAFPLAAPLLDSDSDSDDDEEVRLCTLCSVRTVFFCEQPHNFGLLGVFQVV